MSDLRLKICPPISGHDNFSRFLPTISQKSQIKTTIEANTCLQNTFSNMQQQVNDWWQLAKEDFASLAPRKGTVDDETKGATNEGIGDFLVAGGKNMAAVRSHLLKSLKEKLLAQNVLDEFQCAGVFVNWWTNIRYDLKTISSIGWSPALIPREYFIETYFQTEQRAITDNEKTIADKEVALQELIESVEYEPEDLPDENSQESGEEVTVNMIKDYLKKIAESTPPSLRGGGMGSEAAATLKAIKETEKEIKDLKKELADKWEELDRKINIKCFGIEDEKEELKNILHGKQEEFADLNKMEPTDKKEKNKLNNAIKKCLETITQIQERMAGLEAFLKSIGGIITEEEAKTLILQKHNSLVQQELLKYLNAEKRQLIAGIEKLWDKYAVSSQELEIERTATWNELNQFLMELNYLN